MQEYDIEFKNKRANDIRMYVVKRPNIPAPRKRYREYLAVMTFREEMGCVMKMKKR